MQPQTWRKIIAGKIKSVIGYKNTSMWKAVMKKSLSQKFMWSLQWNIWKSNSLLLLSMENPLAHCSKNSIKPMFH